MNSRVPMEDVFVRTHDTDFFAESQSVSKLDVSSSSWYSCPIGLCIEYESIGSLNVTEVEYRNVIESHPIFFIIKPGTGNLKAGFPVLEAFLSESGEVAVPPRNVDFSFLPYSL